MDKYALSDQTKSRNILPLLAVLWATLVAAYLYWAATYDLSVGYIRSDMSQFEILKNRVIAYASVVAVTGPASAFGLAIPVFLALVPLAVRKHRRAALVAGAVLTLGVCLLWPFSIGVLYLPTALLLLGAVGRNNADPAHAS
jgi:hypothetical protein